MSEEDVLVGAPARRAAQARLGAALTRAGLRRAGRSNVFHEQRHDGLFVLAALGAGRSEHPSVASCVALDLGLGLAPEVGDLRVASLHRLAFVLGSGPACAELCEVHNGMVARLRTCGGEAQRVAGLLDWTVRDDWRNAPDRLWFRTEADLDRWSAYLDGVLALAMRRLETATLDRSRPAVLTRFGDA